MTEKKPAEKTTKKAETTSSPKPTADTTAGTDAERAKPAAERA